MLYPTELLSPQAIDNLLLIIDFFNNHLLITAAWAAASRAIGTLNGEQDT